LAYNTPIKEFDELVSKYNIKVTQVYKYIQLFKNVLIEGYQATHLDVLHSKFYPFCTSAGCIASSLIWNAGISPKDVNEIYGVISSIITRPGINSGGSYSDSREISWKDIQSNCDAPMDLTETAVTSGRTRRCFTFSKDMIKDAQLLNKPTKYSLMRSDYIDWNCKSNKMTQKLSNWINYNLYPLDIDYYFNKNLMYISTGPKFEDYINL
jgi:adenylosuccinate synthase